MSQNSGGKRPGDKPGDDDRKNEPVKSRQHELPKPPKLFIVNIIVVAMGWLNAYFGDSHRAPVSASFFVTLAISFVVIGSAFGCIVYFVWKFFWNRDETRNTNQR